MRQLHGDVNKSGTLHTRIADYFVHCGLSDGDLQLLDDKLDDLTVKPSLNYAPITDIAVIFPAEEPVPSGYKCIEFTTTGLSASLNHGSIYSKEVFLCYKRGWNRPPLVEIGVINCSRDRILPDVQIVEFTPSGRVANVNNTSVRVHLTYKRATSCTPCNELVVTDICVIVLTKDEVSPHTYCIIPQSLNLGVIGSDVHICYRKSLYNVPKIVYKPVLLSRFPRDDYSDVRLPSIVPTFCLPMGASIELWPSDHVQQDPLFSTFVLASAAGSDKMYGASLIFYVSVPAESLSDEQKSQLDYGLHCSGGADLTAYKSVALCVLSRAPMFDAFAALLRFVHARSCANTVTHVPLERYISHFMLNVPRPQLHVTPYVHVQMDCDHVIRLSATGLTPRPSAGSPDLTHESRWLLQTLFSLGVDITLMALACTLIEQKLVLHSLKPDLLTRVAETLHAIIFPLKWTCAYIPLCPRELASIITSPVPFLVGLDSRFFDVYEAPADVICIDLDTNTLSISQERIRHYLHLLPKKFVKPLRITLENAYYLLLNSCSLDYSQLEIDLQEAFIRLMVKLLRGYNEHLIPIKSCLKNDSATPLFNKSEFIRSRDKSHHSFYNVFVHTQLFNSFIDDRSLISDNDSYILQFDQFIKKVEESPNKPLLERVENSSDRTVYISSPEPVENESYQYTQFESLSPHLFYTSASRCVDENPHSSVHSARDNWYETFDSSDLRRFDHEVVSDKALAVRYAESPLLWSKYLLNTSAGLWFLYLPCYLSVCEDVDAVFEESYQMLLRLHSILGTSLDTFCFRTLMQLCHRHRMRVLAVRLFQQMRRLAIPVCALTYGHYNRLLIETDCVAADTITQRYRWRKLRSVIMASIRFRNALKRSQNVGNEMYDKHSYSLDEISNQNLVKSFSAIGFSNHSNLSLNLTLSHTGATSNVFDAGEKYSENQIISLFDTAAGDLSVSKYSQAANTVHRFECQSLGRFVNTCLPSNSGQDCERNELPEYSTNSDTDKDTNTCENTGSLPLEPEAENMYKQKILFKSEPQMRDIGRSTNISMISDKLSILRRGSFLKPSNSFRLRPNRTSLDGTSTCTGPGLRSRLRDKLDAMHTFDFDVPSSIKNSELVKSSVSTLRSAASSVSKMFDDIKENIPSVVSDNTHSTFQISSNTGNESRPRSFISQCSNSQLDIYANRFVLVDLPAVKVALYPIVLRVHMTSCSRCFSCGRVIYDEQIMASWRADENELNTRCSFCGRAFVPLLSIALEPRSKFLPNRNLINKFGAVCKPLRIAYLSPLVLRKEMESIIKQHGFAYFCSQEFLASHSIVYWNLTWYLRRINASSRLLDLLFGSAGSHEDYKHVDVICHWDDYIISARTMRPFHMDTSRFVSTSIAALHLDNCLLTPSQIKKICACIRMNRMVECFHLISQHYCSIHTLPSSQLCRISLYRNLYLLALHEMGSANVSLGEFDYAYRSALHRLRTGDRGRQCRELHPCLETAPIHPSELMCRQVFSQLA